MTTIISYFECKDTTARSRQVSIYLCIIETLRRCVQENILFNLRLDKVRLGKAKAMVLGGIPGGFLIVFYLLGGMFLKNVLKED